MATPRTPWSLFPRMRALCSGWLAVLFTTLIVHANEAVWQWSVTAGAGRAFLWIPEDCSQVRAVIVAQHNMSEEGILEHPRMRAELGKLGIAEVWIAPPLDGPFDFTQGAGEKFENILAELAQESGYAEIAQAPVVPLGHSACATYPWNFAAWKPERTLAVVSYKGDAPQTHLTGYGRPAIAWGPRTIDGVPGLMVMGEYEWLEDRLAPALVYRAMHPRAPIAMLAEPGRGHFDTSDEMVDFLAMFIRKTAEARLPDDASASRALRPVDPARGWRVQRPWLNKTRSVQPAPAARYEGDPSEAFWAIDEEMALAIHHFREHQIGRAPQLLGFVQDGQIVPQTNTHNQVALRFQPEADGLTFRVFPTFLDRVDGGSPNTTRWTGLPPGTRIRHATTGGPIVVSRITGPVAQLGPDTFRVQLNRTASTVDRRSHDVWLLAAHAGDATHKSAVQQALLTLPEFTDGVAQVIAFPAIPDQALGAHTVKLAAISDAGVPVGYYVREGPAFVRDGVLYLTPLPPRTRLPAKVTVVAWQFGRGSPPKLKAADPVMRTFRLVKP